MLKRELLRLLLRADPYALPESTLLAEARLGGHVGETEARDALQFLQRTQMVTCERDPLTEDRSWKLTATGRTQATR